MLYFFHYNFSQLRHFYKSYEQMKTRWVRFTRVPGLRNFFMFRILELRVLYRVSRDELYILRERVPKVNSSRKLPINMDEIHNNSDVSTGVQSQERLDLICLS